MLESGEAARVSWQGKHLHINRRGSWEYVSRNTKRPAVGIVAMHADQRVVLVEQFRPPVGKHLIELPAGLTGDIVGSEDEALLEAARRELLEETGYSAARWQVLLDGYSSPGLTDESITIFLARDLTRQSEGGGVEGESIRIHEIKIDRVIPWLRETDQSADLKLFAALFAAQAELRA